jgi:hypothetical protein
VRLEESIGVEGIFAAVAKAHDLPVAINTKKRDGEIEKSAIEKVLEKIGVKAIAKSMRSSGKGAGASITDQGKGGIDPKKLNDAAYVDDLINTAGTDDELFALQRQARASRQRK